MEEMLCWVKFAIYTEIDWKRWKFTKSHTTFSDLRPINSTNSSKINSVLPWRLYCCTAIKSFLNFCIELKSAKSIKRLLHSSCNVNIFKCLAGRALTMHAESNYVITFSGSILFLPVFFLLLIFLISSLMDYKNEIVNNKGSWLHKDIFITEQNLVNENESFFRSCNCKPRSKFLGKLLWASQLKSLNKNLPSESISM